MLPYFLHTIYDKQTYEKPSVPLKEYIDMHGTETKRLSMSRERDIESWKEIEWYLKNGGITGGRHSVMNKPSRVSLPFPTGFPLSGGAGSSVPPPPPPTFKFLTYYYCNVKLYSKYFSESFSLIKYIVSSHIIYYSFNLWFELHLHIFSIFKSKLANFTKENTTKNLSWAIKLWYYLTNFVQYFCIAKFHGTALLIKKSIHLL